MLFKAHFFRYFHYYLPINLYFAVFSMMFNKKPPLIKIQFGSKIDLRLSICQRTFWKLISQKQRPRFGNSIVVDSIFENSIDMAAKWQWIKHVNGFTDSKFNVWSCGVFIVVYSYNFHSWTAHNCPSHFEGFLSQSIKFLFDEHYNKCNPKNPWTKCTTANKQQNLTSNNVVNFSFFIVILLFSS